MIPLIHLQQQFKSVKKEIMQEIEAVIDGGQYILGPRVQELEEWIALRVNARYAIGVGNGTDALMITLLAMGVQPGDEVITTPFTFIASAEAVSQIGAVPVFADIDPLTYNIDPQQVECRITDRTKAIIPVHIFGQPAPMDDIMQIADRHGVRVIEDACQAFGAKYKGRPVGGLADAACFSFFPSKNLGTMGDGGIILTADPELADHARRLRQHGAKVKYVHQTVGYNSRLDELHAAILLVCLNRIEEWNERRRQLASAYRRRLARVPGIRMPSEAADVEHCYHLFCVECEHRENLIRLLMEKDIQNGVYYPVPLHLQEVYKGLGYRKGDFPNAERAAERLLAIPMSPFLTDDEQDFVIQAIDGFGGEQE